MAVGINRLTRRITIPQADLTLLSGVLYELDVDAMYESLRDGRAEEPGRPFPTPAERGAAKTLSGTTYAPLVEIINSYSVEFEDTGSPYTVKCVGANHNIEDVFIPGTSGVNLIVNNSAGLIVSGSVAAAPNTGIR